MSGQKNSMEANMQKIYARIRQIYVDLLVSLGFRCGKEVLDDGIVVICMGKYYWWSSNIQVCTKCKEKIVYSLPI